MKNKSKQPETPETSPAEPINGPDLQTLSAYIKEKETEENLEKFAKKMSQAWSEPANNEDIPELSFSNFLEKVNKEKGQ